MATLLFYKKPVQLNSDTHKSTRLGGLAGDFSFSKETNSIPLASVEFFDTSREYPIAFTGGEGSALFPIAIVGVRQNENLFVSGSGKWLNARIGSPAPSPAVPANGSAEASAAKRKKP